SGPTLTSDTKTLINTASQSVDGAYTEVVTVANTIGPAQILVGDGQLLNFGIAAGDNDIDSLSLRTTPRTVTTTNTYQIAQTYALTGGAQAPATPLPPSVWMGAIGLAALSLFQFRKLSQA